MVKVKPFHGVRPALELAPKVISPPYDVLDSEEARAMAAGNPYSFLHVNKPEIDLDPSIHIYDEKVYQTGRENLERFIRDGILVQDGNRHFYIYRQVMNGHEQTGIVGCAAADDYMEDRIKKHEFTRPDKEEDRIKLTYVQKANAGPVFLTYKADDAIDNMVADIAAGAPDYDITTDDGVRHVLWVVRDDELNQALESAFAAIPHVYVADGHHRSASGAKVRDWRKKENPNHTGEEEYNYFLAVFFPHDQLAIMAYNRVVQDLNGRSKDQFLAEIGEMFTVEKTGEKEPANSHAFCMYLDGDWYTLTAKPEIIMAGDPVKSLDVSILQENLLAPVLGIGDPRTDMRIKFVGGIRGTGELEKLVDSGKYAVAISMYPTSIEELMNIADAGEVMPPKSTWFEPKLRSGLIVHLLD